MKPLTTCNCPQTMQHTMAALIDVKNIAKRRGKKKRIWKDK
jgi:hypothetical protein